MTGPQRDADTVLSVIAMMAPPSDPGAAAPQPVPAESLRDGDRLREDLGYDSVRLIELTVALEEAFGLPPFPSERLAGVLRVGDVLRLIDGARAGS
ncbi:acyl carrier protein [Tsukamurella sp. 1534]|uniref:acyl carrier protein n=1 Tax=Tsukamurella sp. 1534 TaxID=1151061 RepID=UPI00030BEA7D|nr:acyl carrier protein [Tsukamurella sp. 1534]